MRANATVRILLAVALVGLLAAACGDDDDESVEAGGGAAAPGDIGADPADLSPNIDHPLFRNLRAAEPCTRARRPTETGETTNLEVVEEVVEGTATFAGVEATDVLVMEYDDDELVEETHDYYAQGSDGTVYYLGEHVDNYEDGEVVDHEGEWIAGEGDAQVGVFLPPDPQVGDEFEQERAPDVAEDISTVVDTGVSVSVPADYAGCLETEDVDPLSDDTRPEHKFYCPDVGLVQEVSPEGDTLDLVSLETG